MTETITREEARQFYNKFGSKQDRRRFYEDPALDLLSLTEIQDCLAAAHRAMPRGGLFCHAGLTTGADPITKATSGLWCLIHRITPILVGGCRPLTLVDLLPKAQW